MNSKLFRFHAYAINPILLFFILTWSRHFLLTWFEKEFFIISILFHEMAFMHLIMQEKRGIITIYKGRKLQLIFPCLTEFLNNYVSINHLNRKTYNKSNSLYRFCCLRREASLCAASQLYIIKHSKGVYFKLRLCSTSQLNFTLVVVILDIGLRIAETQSICI